jgi:transglutaminase-like putative cysteine protease
LDPQLREAAMRSTPFVQADAPVIAKTLASIVSPGDRPVEKSIKIVRFVYGRLEKKPVLSVANAVETLEKGRGDCTEHAALTAALGRAAGIPTAIETGLVYQRGRFYYHAWNAFWLSSHGQWVTADPTFNQFPADVTHIRFVRGGAQEQLDILGLLGKLAIEVLP